MRETKKYKRLSWRINYRTHLRSSSETLAMQPRSSSIDRSTGDEILVTKKKKVI